MIIVIIIVIVIILITIIATIMIASCVRLQLCFRQVLASLVANAKRSAALAELRPQALVPDLGSMKAANRVGNRARVRGQVRQLQEPRS
jgi:hypothetical protein